MKIFYDVDTQKDFINKNGALYVPNAELIKPNLKKLTDYARENYIPIVGSVDNHPENDPEFKIFPSHCIERTYGQKKIWETILEPTTCRWEDGYDKGYYVRHDMYHGYPKKPIPKSVFSFWIKTHSEKWVKNYWEQLRKGVINKEIEYVSGLIKNVQRKKGTPKGIYFEKQSYDVFTNPAFPAFLKMANISEAVVYGVATDYCVKAAVLGMQQRDIQCYVVKDVIKGVAPETTQQALEEMVKAGAKFITTKQVLEGKE